MGKPSAPKAPDPYKVADAQLQTNIGSAKAQQQLAMNGQVNPYGSVNYVLDPSSPSGYRQVQAFSPEMQSISDQQMGLMANYNDMTGQQMGRVNSTLSQPFDINAGAATQLSDMQRTFLDPQWQQQGDALQTSLTNRGIRQGSEAYETAMRQFNQQKSGAYDQMYLDAYTKAMQAALANRNQPLAELTALRGGVGQPTALPQFGSSPQPSLGNPADMTSLFNNQYNSQMNQSNAAMSGMYGLGSAALGGWASAGFPGAASLVGLLSDKRIKADVIRIGDDPRGWGVYKFKYILDKVQDGEEAPWQVGYMADEIEKVRPDAVMTHELTGIKTVNYAALAAQ